MLIRNSKYGTQTNDDAAAGFVGEYIESNVAIGGISLTSGSNANMTSLSLGSGDWRVYGLVNFEADAGTIFSLTQIGLTTTSGVLPTSPNAGGYARNSSLVAAGGIQSLICMRRFSLSATTTIYLIGGSAFTVSTAKASCSLWAERRR